ncbi:MAG: TrmB family transcriptional regulator, partial [Candidatus Bathyarchaeia archaeon]
MSEEIERVLSELGLSEKEAKVYLYIAKNGPQKAIEISRNLKMHKVEVYRFLKYLESKALVEPALERPTRFSALPFEQALDSLIAEKKKTARELEEKRDVILDQWKLLETDKMPVAPERFLVLSGRTNIFLKTSHLMKQTQREFLGISTNVAFMLDDQTEFVSQSLKEVMQESRNRQIHARIISQVDEENLNETKSFNQKIQRKHLLVEIRHLNFGTSFIPRLALRDEEEVVIFLTPKRRLMLSKDETGLWTNSKAVVAALKALFEELWQDSQPLAERIEELQI